MNLAPVARVKSISNAMASSDVITGVRLAAGSAGIKKGDKVDLVLIEASAGSTAAACFTSNRFAAAPVKVALEHLARIDHSAPIFLLINSGNANAGTGAPGESASRRSCRHVAEQMSVPASNVLPFSTGVIGELLDDQKIQRALPALSGSLSNDAWSGAAEGIMTTDTRPKSASRVFQFQGQSYFMRGISKGAGMIMPNMATMLCFMATDLPLSTEQMQPLLSKAVSRSFNRITIDGDTSTNDACVLLSTGGSQAPSLTDAESAEVYTELEALCQELALLIVKDAEGGTKTVRIVVSGGASEEDCLEVAYTIAHSPLVKTALYAEDPNWGRILAAIGRARIDFLDVEQVRIALDDVLIAEQGAVAKAYVEADAAAVMAKPEYELKVDLNNGAFSESIWTCDLSHDYVSINADYRS